MDLISNLVDIKTAMNLRSKTKKPKVQEKKNKDLEPNPVDENYEALNCKVEPLEAKDKSYKMLEEYMKNTSDGRNLKVMDIFKIEREGEAKIFNPNKLKNKKLLWHGSRFSNYVGILSNGMRIAPPEAPKTGYAFGKGVYFADLSRKSAPYCCPHLSNGVGIFVVCEVALGESNKLFSCNHDANKLPKGTHSTLAVGQT